MSLFDKKSAVKEPKPLTPKMAQELYDLFRSGKTHTRLFIEDGVSFDDSGAVWNEIKRLETEIIQKVSGNFMMTPAVPEIRDENDKITREAVPAVFYKVTTQSNLEKSLSSDLLDVKILTTDCIRFFPDYDEKRTWGQFKEAFDEKEM